MEMRRLEVFCKVVELKSFTKAAEAVSLSQPTVSEHIRILEDEVFGEKLIDRLGKEAVATAAGKIFYRYARNILGIRDEAVHVIGQFKGKLIGRLLLGASTIPGTYLIPKFIGSFKAGHPSIQITLRIADSAAIHDDIMEGRLDAGFVGSLWPDRRIIQEEIFTDELVLAVYPEHPWAKRKDITIDELAGEPFILREQGSGTRMVMTRILAERGLDTFKMNEIAEMGSTEAVRQSIKAKIGVSILSLQAVKEDFRHKLLVPAAIQGVKMVRPIYLITRKSRQMSPLCTAFINHLKT